MTEVLVHWAANFPPVNSTAHNNRVTGA